MNNKFYYLMSLSGDYNVALKLKQHCVEELEDADHT